LAKCGGVGDWATVWQILPKAVYLLIFNASAFRIITRWNGWRKSLTILVPVFGYIKLFIWPLAKIVQKLSGKLLAAFLFAERFPSPHLFPPPLFLHSQRRGCGKWTKSKFCWYKVKGF